MPPDVVLLGIITTFGNVSVENSTNNVLALNRMTGTNTPVYMGASRPLVQARIPFPVEIHGPFGMGAQRLDAGGLRPQAVSASQFMSDAVRQYPGQVTILAVGPLTDIAQTMQIDPYFGVLVERLVIMGSALFTQGNVTKLSEFNVYADRLAAKIVLESCIPKFIIGLDVSTNVVLFARDQLRLAHCNPLGVGETLYRAFRYYSAFHQRTLGFDGMYMHDAMAFMAAFWPQVFELAPRNIHVDVATGDTTVTPGTCSLVATAVHTVEMLDIFWRLVCLPCNSLHP